MSEPKCGTVAGYNIHTKRKEKPCAQCREAQSIYAKEWRHRTRRSTSKLYSEEEIRDLQAQAWDHGFGAGWNDDNPYRKAEQ